jgi:hypothetical protein
MGGTHAKALADADPTTTFLFLTEKLQEFWEPIPGRIVGA